MFEPIKNEKVYKMVIKQVRDLIAQGQLSPGDRLPPERELANMLSVSRDSVRRAISALEALGVIESRHGEGTFIADDGEDDDLVESFSKLVAIEQLGPGEILEARRIVECPNARLCVARASEEQIERIEWMLESNRMKRDDGASLSEMNRDFHISIAEGTRNRALVRVTETLYTMMNVNLWPRLKEHSEHRSQRTEEHLEQHADIFTAIAARDAERAAAAMASHLNAIEGEFEEDATSAGIQSDELSDTEEPIR